MQLLFKRNSQKQAKQKLKYDINIKIITYWQEHASVMGMWESLVMAVLSESDDFVLHAGLFICSGQ